MTALACQPIDLGSLNAATRRVFEGVEELWVYSLPLNVSFRGVTQRTGLLMRGPSGWGEASPFAEYEPAEASRWLAAGLDAALNAPPEPRRPSVAVNVTVPVVSPEDAAARVHASGGCATAKVKVADPRSTLAQDCARVEAVVAALRDTAGYRARVRVDVNGAWTRDEAPAAIRALNRAARAIGGLEYVEQPCASVEDLAAVRRLVDVPIAADESIRRAEDPMRVVALEAADIAVIKVAPLGGVHRALQIAADTGLEVVVSSAVESSVGIGMGVAACAALPEAPYASGLATVQLLSGDATSSPLLPEGGQIPCRPVVPDLLGKECVALPAPLFEEWVGRVQVMAEHLRQGA